MFRYILYFLHILKARITKQRVPLFVILCVTNRCNLRCHYCYEDYYDRNHKEYTTKEILDLIDTIAAMGTKYICINGGEALLRDDIEQLVDKIKQKKIICNLSTNGLLVKKHLPALKKIDSLAISLDGIGKSNDLNRGDGTYEKIIESFKFLKANKLKFHVHTVLTKNNLNAVDELMALAFEYGFRVQFSPLRKQDSPDPTLALSDEQIKIVLSKVIKYKKENQPVFFSAKAYEHYIKWPYPFEQQIIYDAQSKDHRFLKCYLKQISCHIEAHGGVYPCIVLVNKFKAKNHLEVGFKAAWEHCENIDCVACNNICCNDLNLLFGFHPQVLLNAIEIVFRRIFRASSQKKGGD